MIFDNLDKEHDANYQIAYNQGLKAMFDMLFGVLIDEKCTDDIKRNINAVYCDPLEIQWTVCEKCCNIVNEGFDPTTAQFILDEHISKLFSMLHDIQMHKITFDMNKKIVDDLLAE